MCLRCLSLDYLFCVESACVWCTHSASDVCQQCDVINGVSSVIKIGVSGCDICDIYGLSVFYMENITDPCRQIMVSLYVRKTCMLVVSSGYGFFVDSGFVSAVVGEVLLRTIISLLISGINFPTDVPLPLPVVERHQILIVYDNPRSMEFSCGEVLTFTSVDEVHMCVMCCHVFHILKKSLAPSEV